MEQEHTSRAGSIVVGVDGSDHARGALRWAVAEARRRGVGVRVVVACEPPDPWAYAAGVMPVVDAGELRHRVEATAQTWVDELREHLDAAEREVPIEVEAVTGSPTTVLVDRSEGAALLVVGHRGRGAVRSRLLGSVGLGCVLRATCPVTVVPHETSVTTEAGGAFRAEATV